MIPSAWIGSIILRSLSGIGIKHHSSFTIKRKLEIIPDHSTRLINAVIHLCYFTANIGRYATLISYETWKRLRAEMGKVWRKINFWKTHQSSSVPKAYGHFRENHSKIQMFKNRNLIVNYSKWMLKTQKKIDWYLGLDDRIDTPTSWKNMRMLNPIYLLTPGIKKLLWELPQMSNFWELDLKKWIRSSRMGRGLDFLL